MILHLFDSVIRKVEKTKIAIEQWTTLKKWSFTNTLPNKCFLSDLEENMDRFNEITQDLTNYGEKISDE